LTPVSDTGSQPDLSAEISSENFEGLINCSNLIIRDLKELSVLFFVLQFKLFSPGRNLGADVERFEGLITRLFVGVEPKLPSLSLTLT